MKINLIALMLAALLGLAGCIGVDIRQDTIVSVVISAPAGSVKKGETLTFSALLMNTFGDLFSGAITWTTADPTIATITPDGVLTALKQGQTAVLATHAGITSDPFLVTVVVNEDDLARIVILGSVNTLAIGDSLQLMARAEDAAGNVLEGLTYTWSSQVPAVASVSQTGWVRGLGPGNAGIVATANGISSDPYAVTVGAPARQGTFVGSNGYTVRGGVEVFVENNTLKISLGSDFLASNGPGVYVYLTNSQSTANGGLEVSALRKNTGADTYEVAGSVGLYDYTYVMILCKPFNVPFGYAKLN
ncbi:MAG: DM13 domain-containing protein [Bacteroidia bacterium]|nr:DM13 domain-containing protein [Bacteroidia bacterium]